MQSAAPVTPSLGRLQRNLLAAVAGSLYFLGYPGFDLWPLAFLCLVPVLWAVRGETLKRALALGAVFGLVTNLGGFYWVVHLLMSFARLPLPVAILGCVALSAYQGLLLALVVVLARAADAHLGIKPVFSLPVALPAVEMVFPLLFPNCLGNALYLVPQLTQVADITGVPGLSALVCIVNGGVYELWEARMEQRRLVRLRVGAPLLALVLASAYGVVMLARVDAMVAQAPTLSVGLVQANLGSREKWADTAAFIARHKEMSRQAVTVDPRLDLVIWPESAFNEWITRSDTNLKEQVMEGIDRPLLFGALTSPDPYQATPVSFNSAVLADGDGTVLGRYDKVELLPFGESLPLSGTFPILRSWLPRASEHRAGQTLTPLVLRGVSMVPMICYEDILPAFVRRLWNEGGRGDVLVNLTNDSWYGDTHEPLIHLALATFRTIETRRALMRSTNTGISAIVDPAGRITARTGQRSQEVLSARVPVIHDDEHDTVYMRVGDVFGWMCVALTLLGVLACASRRSTQQVRPAAGM